MLNTVFKEMFSIPAPDDAVCFYANVAAHWDDATTSDKLSVLPPHLQQHLRNFKNRQEMKLSATGKLLLLRVLHYFNVESDLTLEQLEEDQYRRPFFRHSLDFNIAHSGDLVICAGVMDRKVGVDIEQIKAVVIDDYTDLFTEKELAQIHTATHLRNEFFRLWTRKESLLKAIGMGVHLPAATLDVTTDSVEFEEKTYTMKEVFIAEDYCACITVG